MLRTTTLLVLSALSASSPALATFDPPAIRIQELEREAHASASHESAEDLVEVVSGLGGTFVEFESVELAGGEFGSSARAQGTQDTSVESFAIRGAGEALAAAFADSGKFSYSSAEGRTRLTINFDLPVDTPFTLTGNLSVTAPNEFSGEASVGLAAFSGRGLILESLTVLSSGAEETQAFFFSGTIAADTPVQFSISAQASPGEGDREHGDARATFDFDFRLGDRDGDGLLDSWETDGIDFDGGEPEIDLPGLGANPDVKDIFVEIDVMQDVGFDETLFDQVTASLVEKFAQAPPELVGNPGGIGGIQLHLVRDGDRPPNQDFTRELGDGPMPDEFWPIRDQFFGSQDDRDHPFRDAILEARARIFRYGLWADGLQDERGLPDHEDLAGLADGIPGANFIVAAGSMATWRELQHEDPVVQEAILWVARTSTLMHELGHTLGLGHGGVDHIDRKPHYLSVMNSNYGAQMNLQTIQGTEVLELFRLDYSRSSLGVVLEEDELRESEGVRGPSGRKIVFNSAPPGEPSFLNVAWADATTIDWNRSGGTPDGEPYALDLSRTASSQAGGIDLYQTLRPSTDWDRLVYDFTGPGPTPPRGVGEPIAPCLDEASLFAMASAPWNDLTVSLFADGFESGGTTAWSDTSR